MEWLARVGEEVLENQPLVEVETALATEYVRAPASGVLAEILADVDTDVRASGLLAIIDSDE
jgi:pyruvate/2-oxoglutarate dehydrogenase complex dihydrolipoamide acyltransferase (E2) component